MNKFFIVAVTAALLLAILLLRLFNKNAKPIANPDTSKSVDEKSEKLIDTFQTDLSKIKMVPKEKGPVTLVKEDDEEIKKFSDTAQKHLSYLIDFIKENGSDTSFYKYFVKVKFCEGDECEHMWVQVYDYKNNVFIGTLSNDPSTLKLIKFGNKIEVKRDEIEDWLLIDDLLNVKVGGYSQEYIRKTEQ